MCLCFEKKKGRGRALWSVMYKGEVVWDEGREKKFCETVEKKKKHVHVC